MADVLATWTGAVDAIRVEGDVEVVPGYGVFDALGGQLTLGVLTEDHLWSALCGALDLEDVAQLSFAERAARWRIPPRAHRRGALRARPDAAVDELAAAGVPVAPVLDRAGMLGVAHFSARGTVTVDPWAPVATGYPVRFADHPARRTSAPPGLDEHRGQGFVPR